MATTTIATPFQCTFILTSDVHSALEPEKDKRIFDSITQSDSFPALKAQSEQKKMTPDTEMGGAVRRIQYIATERELGRPLVLDAGDFLSGTLWFKAFKGSLDVKIMNLMQYDAMAIGNHDFDLGWDHLKELLKETKFSVLCSNIFEIDPESKKAKEEPILKPFEIFELEGRSARVAVIGIMGREAWDAIGKDKKLELEFRSPNKVLAKLLDDLPRVDYTVLLSHSGIIKDRKFAAKFPRIDAILGGHSHTLMDQNEQIGKTVILHPGARGRVIAKLEVNGDKTKSSVEILDPSWDLESRGVKMSETAQKIVALLRENKSEAEDSYKKVVATCIEPISSRDKKNKNTDLGKLLCDMLCTVEDKADIAFIPSGTIRVDELEKGPITLKDLTSMLQDGPLWTITGNGNWVEKIMAVGESRWGGPNKQFQYGGIEKSAEGGFLIQGKPLEQERWYRIRGPKFFFEREDRPEALVQKEYIEHQDTLSELITTAFTDQREIKKSSL